MTKEEPNRKMRRKRENDVIKNGKLRKKCRKALVNEKIKKKRTR